MANEILIGFGFLAMAVMLGSVLGTVERRERFSFVAGVVLVGVGLTLSEPAALGAGIALVGLVAILGSTVPLLRQSV